MMVYRGKSYNVLTYYVTDHLYNTILYYSALDICRNFISTLCKTSYQDDIVNQIKMV